MKPAAKRSLIVLAICAVCTGALAILWSDLIPPLHSLHPLLQDSEWSAEDLQMRILRKTPMDDRLVFIGMDKPLYDSDFSEAELKQEPVLSYLQTNYPWSRAVWARLIEKLADAGAKTIVIDVVFATPNDPKGDEALKNVLEKYKNRVVLAYNISQGETDRGDTRELQLPYSSVLDARATNSPVEDDRLGYDNTWPDYDGIFREADYRLTSEEAGHVVPENVTLESLDARALEKFGCAGLIPQKFDEQRFRYTGPPGTFKPYPLGYVLSPKLWEKNYKSGQVFKDKLVMVGPAAEIFHDQHDTPFTKPTRQMLGPEVHLNIINAALHGEFLRAPSLPLQLFVISMAGISAAALCFLVQQPLKRFSLVVLVAVIYWAIAFFAFNHAVFSIWLLAVPTVALISSSGVATTYDYFLERREKRRLRQTFERFVSRDVAKELLDNPETFLTAKGGSRRPVTILFCDVRGFTTMTESADESQLVKQLNEYFENWVQTVFEHEGSLDKFIGDAVMAVWGNIERVSRGEKKDAQNAVATALKMKPKLEALNEAWKARGWRDFHIGIGINHGMAIVAEIGSSQKAEITAIGDAVNVASRLEGLTKKYHVDLLLGESMAELVGDNYILRTVASVQPKGKTKPGDVFTVMGDGAAQTVSMPVWLARYEEGVRLYRQRKFSEAAAEFQECLRRQPDDYLSARYLEFCQNLIKNPPDELWTAAEVMTDK